MVQANRISVWSRDAVLTRFRRLTDTDLMLKSRTSSHLRGKHSGRHVRGAVPHRAHGQTAQEEVIQANRISV